jgi:hypothetical protein
LDYRFPAYYTALRVHTTSYKIQARRTAMQISLFTNGMINTKSVMKASISLAVAAMFLTAAFANPKGHGQADIVPGLLTRK